MAIRLKPNHPLFKEEDSTSNLAKNPDIGGIPAVENNNKVKAIDKNTLLICIPCNSLIVLISLILWIWKRLEELELELRGLLDFIKSPDFLKLGTVKRHNHNPVLTKVY